MEISKKKLLCNRNYGQNMTVKNILFLSIVFLLCLSVSAQKQLTKLSINVTDANGNPLSGTFSVSVCDADFVPVDSCNASGMAELLLCSEIKGRVENPNYYFQNISNRTKSDLDVLLMTQGWRRYEAGNILNRKYPAINNNIEQTQTISGRVTTTLKKAPRNMTLSVFNPQTLQIQSINLGDSSRFTINGVDLADGESLTIEATKKSGATNFIQIHIDTIQLPQLQIHDNTPLTGSPAINDYAARCVEQQKYQDIYKTIKLPDVLVKTEKRFRNRKGTANRGLMAGNKKIERFTDIQAMLRWLGIQVRINDMGQPYFGKAASTFVGEQFTLTPTYIDENRIEQEELWDIIPTDIEQVEYLTPNDPSNIIYSNEAVAAGCLLVYLKDGKQALKSRDHKLNVAFVKPLGYQLPVEYYSPQYTDKDKSAYTMPDMRTTLYWNPKLRTDNEGNARMEFYNSDTSKRYMVTIEGTADDGTIVSNQTIIDRQ